MDPLERLQIQTEITILFIDEGLNRQITRKMKARPCVGDAVEWFYMPSPIIKQVLIPSGEKESQFTKYDFVCIL